MRRRLAVARPVPPLPWFSELIELDTASIPYLLGSMWTREQRYHWITADDARDGRQMLAKQGAAMLLGAADRIIESVDRVYRLIDVVNNGAVYTYSGLGTLASPYVYSPGLPVVPSAAPGDEPSVKFSLEKLLRLQDNLTNGTTYGDAPDDRNFRQQLDDIKAALESGESLDPEILAELVQILAALA